MFNHKNQYLKEFSQNLRKNQTKEERKLWYGFLQYLPVTVNRQKVFDCYIADFYCAKYKTIIELDGKQHLYGPERETDRQRDEYFKRHGIKVLRFSNDEINNNFESVCETLKKELNIEKNERRQ